MSKYEDGLGFNTAVTCSFEAEMKHQGQQASQ
jgi:hypothetical protein